MGGLGLSLEAQGVKYLCQHRKINHQLLVIDGEPDDKRVGRWSVVGRLEVSDRVSVQFRHPKGNTGTRISCSSLRGPRNAAKITPHDRPYTRRFIGG